MSEHANKQDVTFKNHPEVVSDDFLGDVTESGKKGFMGKILQLRCRKFFITLCFSVYTQSVTCILSFWYPVYVTDAPFMRYEALSTFNLLVDGLTEINDMPLF